MTDTGRVVAAWQERVDDDGSPDPTGTPRIIVMRSADGGGWEGLGSGGARVAIDASERNEPFDPGLATPVTAPHTRPSGPQVMPKLSFGGGQLMLSFYESRGWIVPAVGDDDEDFDYGAIEIGPAIAGESWMSGYDRVVDLRAALLNRQTGGLVSPSIQVSRYPISGSANLSDGSQDLSDVAPINPPCSPDHDYLFLDPDFVAQYSDIEAFNPCVRRVNRINSPHSAVGTSAFAGDYNDLAPYVQFVFDTDPEVNAWRWATEPGDVSTRGFHSVWTDNRHLIPPQNPEPANTEIEFEEWAEFPAYGAPNSNALSCINPGSRNADVLTARINSGLAITAPTTYKQLDAERSFPFTVANQSNINKFYEIETTVGQGFSKLNPIYDNVDAVRVMVFPYSSTSQLLTVQPSAQSNYEGPFKVEVRELVCGDPAPDPDSEFFADEVRLCGDCSDTDYSNGSCQFGSVVFNAFGGNNPVGNLDPYEPESYGPTISNAFVINYNVENAFVINDSLGNNTLDNAFVINKSPDNAFVINDSPENAFVINAFVINAFVINKTIYDVIDVVWEMEPGTANTASSYLPLVNIDFAEQFLDPEDPNYAFQLIVDKPASYGTHGILDDCNAETFRAPQGQILSNVVQDPTEIDNAFVINKRPENAFVINETEQNAFVINAFVINSTFPMAPEDNRDKRLDAFTKETIDYGDSETKADPPSNKVRVTLRAYQLKDSITITNADQPLFNPSTEEGGWVPSTAVAEVSCEGDCFTINGPNLIPSSTVTATPENPLTAETCGVLEFDPETFTVSNPNLRDGTKDAITRGDLQRHGFYLRDYDDDGNMILDRFLGDFTAPKTLAVGASYSNPDAISLDIPSDIAEGDYTLLFFADYPLLVSEYDETDNTEMFPLTVTAVEPPDALDFTYKTDQDVPLTASLADHIDNPNDYAPLEYAKVDGFGPSNGTVDLDEATGAFTYTPDLGFVGTDSFDWTVSYCNQTSDSATMTIEVIATCGWEFVGLKSPLNGVQYTAKAGSVVPLAWRYDEPIGTPVDSSNAGPSINFKGWPGLRCSEVTGGPAIDFTLEEDPGSSDLRYSDDSWQFNWQTKYPEGDPSAGSPLPKGCYQIFITLEDECVGNTDGPFKVYLK